MVSKSKEVIAKTFAARNDVPKYIFGWNKYAIEVSKYVNIAGFIDEKTEDGWFEGRPVIHSLSEIPFDAIILSCVVEGASWAVEEKLSAGGGAHVDYFSFVRHSGLPLAIEYWDGFAESYANNKAEYDAIRGLLQDELSLQTFDHLIAFKLHHDISQMSMFTMNLKEQYFEPFLNLKRCGESFCDVGGFDGGTTLHFIQCCPEYEKVYYWEPEPDAMAASKAALGRFPRIEYISQGAADTTQTLHFKRDGSASKISGSGDISIPVSCIDDQIKGCVTFIKMDIEGSEVAAINGARQTILRHHPKLAICAYHKGDDFIQIPKAVLGIRGDYAVYLRHYTQGIFETVMFFVPK